MKYYDLEEGKYPSKENLEKENEYIGDEWSVKISQNKYTLNYLSGELQGRLKQVQISYDDFMLLKEEKISLYDFMLKNNLS